MKILDTYKELINEALFREEVNYGPKAEAKCDCCKYFDFESLNMYSGYKHPIYNAINKHREELLEFMSPEDYLKECAYNAGIPYSKYITPGPGSPVTDKYKEYANRMKAGEKAPIGFY